MKSVKLKQKSLGGLSEATTDNNNEYDIHINVAFARSNTNASIPKNNDATCNALTEVSQAGEHWSTNGKPDMRYHTNTTPNERLMLFCLCYKKDATVC